MSTKKENFMDSKLPDSAYQEKPKGIYGRNLTSEMMRELDWNSYRILDFFEGIWRKKGAKVRVSNEYLQRELEVSYGSVCRALKLLEGLGYIRRTNTSIGRVIIPGGVITGDQGGDQERSGGVVTDDHHKTYKDKNPVSVKESHPPSRDSTIVSSEVKKSLLEAKREDFLKQGKTAGKFHEFICLSKQEQDAALMAYEREDLDLAEGLDLLTHCAWNNTEKFLSYDSHYSALIGWVLDAVRKRDRERIYHDNAKRRNEK